MKKIFYLVPCLILASCVPQSDYDKLKIEKEEIEQKVTELETKLSNVEFEHNQLLEEKRQAEIERNKTPYISEAKAMQYIKDNYLFYEKDTKYRNIQLRRIADNSFRVSLEECSCKSIGGGDCCNDNFFWDSRVRTLTIHNNGTYDF